MKLRRSSTLLKIIVLVVALTLLTSPALEGSAAQSGLNITPVTACRYGINAPLPTSGYDIASLKVGSLLDWQADTNPSLPPGVEYIRVLRLRDDLYDQTLADLPAWVDDNPGSVWIIGNEPDTTYEDQDGILAETYADRYYALATIIRAHDKTAQLGFGPIVQPTPLRIRYLDRAWDHLVLDAGSASAASSLVDIWTPHSFILNEEAGQWGAGIPPGFGQDHTDAIIITDYADTYSISIFMQRIINFRTWMASIGQRSKPLWITEYGSLFPPVDPIGGPDYVNVSDDATALYMWNTFSFLQTASENQTGMPADGNQLVQRWYWFSLNEHRYLFGGSLYNPDYPENYGPLLTLVGQNFINHQNQFVVEPDLFPSGLTITPISPSQLPGRFDYRLDITIDNNEFADATCAQVWVYDGDPGDGGTLIAGPLPASRIQANFGTGLLRAYWQGVLPNENHTLYVKVEPIGTTDTNPANNLASFNVFTLAINKIYLPIIRH